MKHSNARSLCNKFNEFALFATTQNPDIVCVSETWLHTDIPDSLVCPNGYCVTRCDRNGRGGGIAIFVHNSVKFSVVDIPSEFSALEMICIDVQYGAQTCRIIRYYRSPGCSAQDIDYMLLSVRSLQKLCSSDKVTFIIGDFNLPHIDWSYYHATDNIIYNSFLKFVKSYGLIQFVDQPTREDNILDLVLSTSDMSISDVDVFPPIGNSDHNVVMFNTNFVNSLNNHSISTPTFFDWSRANYAMISEDLCSVN